MLETTSQSPSRPLHQQQALKPSATLLGPSPKGPLTEEHSQIHHQLIRGKWGYMGVVPDLKIVKPSAIVWMLSSLRAFKLATPLCRKPRLISSPPPQTHCVFFVKRSCRQSNTGCGNGPGSMRLDKASLELLLRPSMPLPPVMAPASVNLQ